MAVFVNKVTRKVIKLVDDNDITQDEVLAPYVGDDMLPEGVNCVQVSMQYPKLNPFTVNTTVNNYTSAKGVEVAEELFIYDHSGIAIFSNKGDCKCWDTSTVGYIKVKADTAELAKKHLDATVKAWDDYYRYGVRYAEVYSTLTEFANRGMPEDVVTVVPDAMDNEQVIEAAKAFEVLGNEDDWVRMSELEDEVVLKELRAILCVLGPDSETIDKAHASDLLDSARTLLDAIK